MKIAIMGFRGIPSSYGGFETFAEELAKRLTQRGHRVTAYGRPNHVRHKGAFYENIRLIILPALRHKYLETITHTFLSVVHGLFHKYDIILMLNAANSIFAFVPKLTGKKVVLNVDGIDRLRKKWSILGKMYYRLGEYLATRLPDAIVSDAEVIREYYLEVYAKDSTMIPYGAWMEREETQEILEKLSLKSREYVLYVSRLEPENNAHIVIQAFKETATEKKLVIVGDAPYAKKYKKYLRKIAAGDERILFTGFIFGKGYRELQCHAYCYIQATEVGGTHPALVEAMASGNCVVANKTPENREVLQDAGLFYKKNDIQDLKDKIQLLIENPSLVEEYRKKARQRAEKYYTWERVTDSYEELFLSLLANKKPKKNAS